MPFNLAAHWIHSSSLLGPERLNLPLGPWATLDTIVMSYLLTLKWNKWILTFNFENNAAQWCMTCRNFNNVSFESIMVILYENSMTTVIHPTTWSQPHLGPVVQITGWWSLLLGSWNLQLGLPKTYFRKVEFSCKVQLSRSSLLPTQKYGNVPMCGSQHTFVLRFCFFLGRTVEYTQMPWLSLGNIHLWWNMSALCGRSIIHSTIKFLLKCYTTPKENIIIATHYVPIFLNNYLHKGALFASCKCSTIIMSSDHDDHSGLSNF